MGGKNVGGGAGAGGDISLVFQVDEGSSANLIEGQIKKIIENINESDAVKIKLQFDDTVLNAGIEKLKQQISDIGRSLQSGAFSDISININNGETSKIETVESIAEKAAQSVDALAASIKNVSSVSNTGVSPEFASSISKASGDAIKRVDALEEKITEMSSQSVDFDLINQAARYIRLDDNIDVDEIDKFNQKLGNIVGQISKVTVGWKDYGEQTQKVKYLSIDYVDAVGDKYTQLFNIVRKANKDGSVDVSISDSVRQIEESAQKSLMTQKEVYDAIAKINKLRSDANKVLSSAGDFNLSSNNVDALASAMKQLDSITISDTTHRNEYTESYSLANTEISKYISLVKEEIDVVRNSILTNKQQSDAMKRINAERAAASNLLSNATTVGAVPSSIDDLSKLIEDIDILKNKVSVGFISNKEYAESISDISRRSAEYSQSQKSTIDRMNNEIAQYEKANVAISKLNSLQEKINSASSFVDVTTGDVEEISRINTELERLRNQTSSITGNKIADAGFNKSLIEISNSVDTVAASIKKADAAQKESMKSASDEVKYIENISSLLKKAQKIAGYTAAASDPKTSASYSSVKNIAIELERMNRSLKEDGLDGFISKFPNASGQIEAFKKSLNSANVEIIANNKNTKSLADRLSGLAGKFGVWLSITSVMMKAVQATKQLVNESISLDSSMTNLRIVANETADSYARYADNIAKTAQEIGVSMTDLIDATTTYARLGYSLDESSGLAKVTGMLQRVGDIEASDAQNAVTAIIKAFDIDASNVDNIMAVGDKLVKVGNEFPISVSQIAEGINNAASALSASGNTFEESVALLTAATTISQNASKASTGLRTIAARIRNVKTELDDLGEAMTDAKYEEIVDALSRHNVALMDVNGEFRSTYDIMSDIAAKWEDLTSSEQSALASELAGNRQQEVFYSIIEQFREASGAMDAMSNSTGKLSSAYEQYLGSAQASIESFKSAVQSLAINSELSSSAKFVVDLGTEIVNLTDSLAKVKMLLPTIAASVVALKIASLVKDVTSMTVKTKLLAANIIEQTGGNAVLKASVDALDLSQRKYLETLVSTMAIDKSLDADKKKAIATNYQLATSIDAVKGASTTSAAVGAAAGSAATAATGWIGIAVAAIGLLLSLAPKIKELGEKYALKKEREEVAELEAISDRYSDAISKINDASSNLSNSSSTVSSVRDELIELSSGVDEFGNNISLSESEYDRFIEINNQLADVFPDIKTGMDENGNAMTNLRYNAMSLSSQLDELVSKSQELALADIKSGLPDVVAMANTKQTEYDTTYNNALEPFKRMQEDASNIMFLIRSQTFDEANKIILGSKEMYEEYSDVLRSAGISFYSRLDEDTGEYNIFLDKQVDAIAKLEDYIRRVGNISGNIQRKTADEWNDVVSSVTTLIVNTDDFKGMSDSIQGIIVSAMSDVDISQIEDRNNPDAVYNYIYDKYVKPVQDATPDVRSAIEKMYSAYTQYNGGDIGISEYIKQIQNAVNVINESGIDGLDIYSDIYVDENSVKNLKEVKDIMHDGLISDESIKNTEEFADKEKEVFEYLDLLDKESFDIAYKIVSEEGYMSLDDLKMKVDNVKSSIATFIDTFQLDKFFASVDNATKNIDKITSAMQKLKNGTSLTRSEMFKLAEQFPELLKQSNLFTDGSIAGQQKMLEAIVKTYDAELKATVDAKTQELEKTILALDAQIGVEKKKAEAVVNITAEMSLGKINEQKDFIEEWNKLQMLEGVKYIEMKDGELRASEEFLRNDLEQEDRFGKASIENVWVPHASMIERSYEVALIKSGQKMEEFANSLMEQLLNGTISMSDVIAGFRYISNDPVEGYDYSNLIWTTVTGEENFAEKMNEWSYHYIDNINDTIDNLEQAKIETQNIIDNINAIAGVSIGDVDGFFDSGGSSAGASASDNAFKKEYEYHKHLVAMEQETLADFYKWLKDASKAAYDSQIISIEDYRKYEEEVFSGEKKLIDDSKKALDALIDYKVKMQNKDNDALKSDLKSRLDALKEFYDKQKEMLKKSQDEMKYQSEQEEKQKAVSDIQNELLMLQYDTSAYAARRKIELQEDLAQAQKELDEFELDHAIDVVTDKLDSQYEKEAKALQDQIDAIEEAVNSPDALYNQALISILDNSEAIKEEMIEYNNKNGDGNPDTIEKLFEDFNESLEQYAIYYGSSFWDAISEEIQKAQDAAGQSQSVIKSNTFTSADGRSYKILSDASMFTDSLMSSFINNTSRISNAMIEKMSPTYSSMPDIRRQVSPVINMGDIIVNGSTNERTVSEIRRAERENIEFVLKRFTALSK